MTGIGAAMLKIPKSDKNLSELNVELNLEQLEFFMISTGRVQWHLSLARNGRYPTPWAKRERIDTISQWGEWQSLDDKGVLSVEQSKHGIKVIVPVGSIETRGFWQLEWVDWYR